jgi:hypothetical protein
MKDTPTAAAHDLKFTITGSVNLPIGRNAGKLAHQILAQTIPQATSIVIYDINVTYSDARPPESPWPNYVPTGATVDFAAVVRLKGMSTP